MAGKGQVREVYRQRVHVAVLVLMVMFLALSARTTTQIPYDRGQDVVPAFEGWEQNPDGTIDMVFGYFNRNYEEILDIPVGPDNSIEPGGPDQGQPTHFYPRRNWYTFKVRIPKDFGKKEMVWTLKSKGKTEYTYGSLLSDYILHDRMKMTNVGGFGLHPSEFNNKPPVVTIEGPLTRTVKVGEPLTLMSTVTDDGIPENRSSVRQNEAGASVLAVGGLRAGWLIYRGSGRMTFNPEQVNPGLPRLRRGSNLAAGARPAPLPPDGKLTTVVTFQDAGTYVLQFMGHDGGLAGYKNITITVQP